MLTLPVGHQPKAIVGLLEVGETYFKISRKGSRFGPAGTQARGRFKGKGRHSKDFVPVLVGRARGQGFTVDKVLKDMTKEQIAGALAWLGIFFD